MKWHLNLTLERKDNYLLFNLWLDRENEPKGELWYEPYHH